MVSSLNVLSLLDKETLPAVKHPSWLEKRFNCDVCFHLQRPRSAEKWQQHWAEGRVNAAVLYSASRGLSGSALCHLQVVKRVSLVCCDRAAQRGGRLIAACCSPRRLSRGEKNKKTENMNLNYFTVNPALCFSLWCHYFSFYLYF